MAAICLLNFDGFRLILSYSDYSAADESVVVVVVVADAVAADVVDAAAADGDAAEALYDASSGDWWTI